MHRFYLRCPGRIVLLAAVWCGAAALADLMLPRTCAGQDTSRSSGWVVISVDEYKRLRALAYPTERDTSVPPVDATLTRVEYDLRVNGELATGQAAVTIDVIRDAWVRVPIPTGLYVREARLDGKPVSLVAGGEKEPGPLSVILPRAGRFTLALDVALPVTSNAGNEGITLPNAISGVTRAQVQLPRPGMDVRLGGGVLVEASESAAESRWLAYGSGNQPLTFTWRKKSDDRRNNQTLRLRGALTEVVGLGEDSTSVNAEVSVEILQGAAAEVRIVIPDKVEVNQVSGAMVADWEMKGNELAVTFLEPADQNARFVLTGETRSPRDGQIAIPILRLAGAERESGGVAVEVLGAGEIKDSKLQGLEAADASDLGELVSSRQSPSLLAFRFRSADANATRALTVNVARYTQQAVLMANVEEARYEVLMTDEGKTLVQGRFAVRNNQRNFLKVTLPAGAQLWSATLSGTAVRPGQAPDGGLLLPLEKARGGEDAPAFAVEILYVCPGKPWDEKGKVAVPLPKLDLPVSRTGMRLQHPPLFKVLGEPGSFHSEPFLEPSSPVLARRPESSVLQPPARPAPAAKGKETPTRIDALQALVDRFNTQTQAGRGAGILPIKISVPVVGPSIFLMSELTGENQAPTVELIYQRTSRKGGVR
jgi:hypothetical protein